MEAAAREAARRIDEPSDLRTETRREGLAKITDPRAVPMIMKVFVRSSEATQLVAVQLFAQIEGPAASFWLALLAVDSPSAEVRRQATNSLKGRDRATSSAS